jgi:hypothetical protein
VVELRHDDELAVDDEFCSIKGDVNDSALSAERYAGRASSSTSKPATLRMDLRGCSAMSNGVDTQAPARLKTNSHSLVPASRKATTWSRR